MKRHLSPFPIPGWWAVALLIAASSTVGCAGGSSPPPAPSGKVHVSVAPLDVNGVSNACYSLAITSLAGGGSWSQSGICAEEYGDGQGAISFTAPCDATGTGANTVTLTVDNLFSGPDESVPLDRNTWNNPCGDPSEADYDGNPPCTQQVTCKANADTPVTFDLTIMRSSNRGFFDVAVTFDNIFCSAKVDCEDPNGAPLRLVYDPASGGNVDTAVLAFACTDGEPEGGVSSDPHLYLNDVVLRCGSDVYTIDPSKGPGKIFGDGTTPDPLIQAVVSEGADTVRNGPVTAGEVFWTISLGLRLSWLNALPAGTHCSLETQATVSRGPLADGATPAGAVYPYIDVNVPLYGDGARLCSQHPLNGAAPHDGVHTAYVRSAEPGRPLVPKTFTYVTSEVDGVVTTRPVHAPEVPIVPDPCASVTCGLNEGCVITDGETSCECLPGFEVPDSGGDCQDIDACLTYPCEDVADPCEDLPAPAGGDVYGRLCGTWTEAPLGAEEVDDAEFAALAATGTLTPVSADYAHQQQVAAQEQAAEDQATIDEILERHPGDTALHDRIYPTIDPTKVTVLPDGNTMVTLPTGPDGTQQQVILQAGQTRLHEIASAYRRFNTYDNQLAIYKAMYPNMSDECLLGKPAPADAASLGFEDLKVLNKQLAQCWRDNAANLGESSEQPVAPGQPYEGDYDSSQAGYGGDHGGYCPHDPRSTYATRSWMGKAYDSPVRNQGNRGSCTAFGIIGALENAAARSSHRWLNLSEQALYARAKLRWAPGNDDGLWVADTVNHFAATGWKVPLEQVWPYNQSWERRRPCEDDCGLFPYTTSCTENLGQDHYSGPACSNTVHQAKAVYYNHRMHFWTPLNPAKGVVGMGASLELLDIEDPLSASFAMAAVSHGFGVVVAMNVYDSFFYVPRSFRDDGHPVGDDGHWPGDDGHWPGKDSVDNVAGSHALQLSGVLSDHQGSGWLVLRNSWGTCWGDGGYAYVKYEDADSVLLDVVAILPTVTPDHHAPTVHITSPQNGEHFLWGGLLAEPIHFAATASDPEDGSACCGFDWSTTESVLSKSKTFDQPMSDLGPGPHEITFSATDSGGMRRSSKITIYIDNSPPVLTVSAPTNGQTVYVNTPFLLEASATDPNEPGGIPCNKIYWASSDSSDPFHGGRGCQIGTSVSTLGDRTISVSAGDDVGAWALKSVLIHVVAVPPAAPPIVTITSPFGTAVAPYTLADPSADLTMQASVTSPGGFADCPRFWRGPVPPTDCVSYTWTGRRVIGNQPWTSIGSTKNPTWNPQAVFHFGACENSTVEAKLCVKDPNGTTCKSTFLAVHKGPC